MDTLTAWLTQTISIPLWGCLAVAAGILLARVVRTRQKHFGLHYYPPNRNFADDLDGKEISISIRKIADDVGKALGGTACLPEGVFCHEPHHPTSVDTVNLATALTAIRGDLQFLAQRTTKLEQERAKLSELVRLGEEVSRHNDLFTKVLEGCADHEKRLFVLEKQIGIITRPLPWELAASGEVSERFQVDVAEAEAERLAEDARKLMKGAP